jgi:type I restriction enzyme S subunit
MTAWPAYRLDELGTVERGRSRHRPRNDPILYGGPYPFFQTGDVKATELHLHRYSQTYSEEGLQQSRLWPVGTLCITIAANIAETAVLAIPGCFPDSIVGFRANSDVADVYFIKYVLDRMKLRMQSISEGTTQGNLSLDKLLSIGFSIPPPDTQRRIVAILRAHDELIEANLRRIKVLEDMAKATFMRWFVQFQFPEAEPNAFRDTAIGRIPQSFKVESLSSLVEFVPGTEPGSDRYSSQPGDGMVRFFRVGDLGESARAPVWIPEQAAGNRLEPNDIALTLDGTVGRVRIGLRGAYSSGIRKVIPNVGSIGWAYLYELLRSEQIQGVIKSHSTGTTILHAAGATKHMTFALPPRGIVDAFEGVARPILRLRINLEEQNLLLRRMRDLFVPRLMSGSMDVSQLDIDTTWLAT